MDRRDVWKQLLHKCALEHRASVTTVQDVQEVKEIMSNFINNEAPALTLKSSSEHEAAPAESEDLGLNFTG